MGDIYYIGFPTEIMITSRRAVPFEVVWDRGQTLLVRLCEDVPPDSSDSEELSLPKAGDEFEIRNEYMSLGKKYELHDFLRNGNIVHWYVSTTSGFKGCIYLAKPEE